MPQLEEAASMQDPTGKAGEQSSSPDELPRQFAKQNSIRASFEFTTSVPVILPKATATAGGRQYLVLLN